MVLFFYAFLSGRETVKACRLSCSNHYLCHVEGLLLKERFLNFGAVGVLIRPFGASIYTPPGSVSGDADRATLCPMGSRCPGLNAAFLDAFGSDQGESLCFSSSYCTTFHVFTCVHYEYTLKEH